MGADEPQVGADGPRIGRPSSARAAESASRFSDARGQTEVLGVVLLLAITITGTGLIVAFGSSALSDSQQASETDSAEHSMTQLDSKASLVGVGSTRTQTVSLGVSGPTRVENESGWMRVQVINLTDDTVEYVVLNQTLGSVVYENTGTSVAYQGGGVWKRTDNGTTMVSPPEVHYRGTTLTLPLVVVSGQGTLDGETLISQNGSTEPKYPNGSAGLRNPLTEAKVNLTIQSEYYRAWGRFFERRTGGQVAVDHANRTVTLTLVAPFDRSPIAGGIVSTASGDQLQLDNQAYVDSYNSSEGTYSDTEAENGTIVTAGGVELSNKAEIKADLVSGGGKVSLEQKHTEIAGNLSYKALGSTKGSVGGWKANNGSAPDVEPVEGLIDAKVEEIRSSNDNSDESDITSENYLDDGQSSYHLDDGKYYLDEINVPDKTLELDTTDGNITIAVENGVSFDETLVDVQGEGTVRVYMDGQSFSMDNHAKVAVPGQESTRFWLYGPPGTDVDFQTQSNFTGVVYAPDSESQSGAMAIKSQSEVFGALVGTITSMDNSAVIHFDEAILSVEDPTGPTDEATPRVTYMHVTVNRVNVTSV
jgi:flagellin-like protein